MKKKALAILLCVILCICASGISVYASDENIIDNNIFYVEIPQGFTYIYSSDNYQLEHDDTLTEVQFYVFGNIMFSEGIKNASDDSIKDFLRRELALYSIDFNAIEVDEINGISVKTVSFCDNSLSLNHKSYIYATKEYVCIIDFALYSENDEETKLIKKITDSFVINGTHFNGEIPENPHDFSDSDDYYTEVNNHASEYYDESEKFDESFGGLFALILLLMLGGPAIIILTIVLFVNWRKQKKIVKEYEEIFGPIGVAQAQFARLMNSNGNFQSFNNQGMNNNQFQNNFDNTPFMANNGNMQQSGYMMDEPADNMDSHNEVVQQPQVTEIPNQNFMQNIGSQEQKSVLNGEVFNDKNQ